MDGKLDLLLKGGRVLDPATGRDEIADIGVKDGVIAAIDRHMPGDAADAVEDVCGQLVVAGLIDTHGHVYQHVTGKFGLPPDEVGVASGVTTVVDRGGPSCMTVPGLHADDRSRGASPFHGVAPFNLTHAMTELLALGMQLPGVVASVTGNAAAMLGLSDTLGSLKVGRAADISVLRLTHGRFVLRDNSGETMIAPTMIAPVYALRQGRRFAAESKLVPPAESAA